LRQATPEDTRIESAVEEHRYDKQRDCTRCDGKQHLVGASGDFGKYRCDICEMSVGFDISSSPAEFLIYRGLPGRYTKNVYGERMKPGELRF
jgi:transcription elongation factor Elf1